jgi:hypothetical protein
MTITSHLITLIIPRYCSPDVIFLFVFKEIFLKPSVCSSGAKQDLHMYLVVCQLFSSKTEPPPYLIGPNVREGDLVFHRQNALKIFGGLGM